MNSRMYRRLLTYVVAIDTTAIALLLMLWLKPLMIQTSSALFFIAIIVSTWYGGIYPGIVCAVLSVLAIDYFLIPPIYQISLLTTDDLLRLAIFIFMVLLIDLLSTNLKHSKRKVERLNRILREENADRLRTALNAAQMGMWDWDFVTGKITWSEEHERLFGLAPGSFDGRYETFDACLHPEDREGFNQAIAYSLKNHIPYYHEFRVVWPKNGSVHWIEGRGKAFYNHKKQPVRMSGTIILIDSRKQTEILLKQQFEQQRLVLEMTQRIRRSLNLHDILQTTVDEVREYLKTDRVIIFKFTPAWGGTIVVESVVNGWMPLLPLEIYDPCIGEQYVKPFIQGLVTAKSDIYNSGISRCHIEFLAQLQVRANLVVPVMKDDKLWGLLAAHHCAAPRQWQKSEINLLQQLAAQVSVALQQSELFEQVQTELVERKQAEAALQQREAILRLFARYAPAGIAMFDRDMRYVMASQRWADEYNLGVLESLIGRSHYELFPEIPERWRQINQRCLAGAIEKCDEDLFIRADGTQQWLSWEAHPWYTATNEIGGIIIFSVDITKRKQAEQNLANASLRIQTLFNTSLDGIVILDRQGKVLDTNPRFAEMLGYTSEEMAKLNIADWDAKFTKEEVRQLLEDSINLTNGVLETRHRRKDGSIYDVEVSYSIVEWQGEILRFSACRDITERKQAQLALEQLNAELEARVTERTTELTDLYNHAPCGYHSLDSEGFFILINDTELNWLGYTREEILGKKKMTDLLTPGSKEIFYQNFPKLKQQGWVNNLEFQILNKNGMTRWVSLNATAIRDLAGNFIMSRSTMFDITDRKRMEEALRQSEETFRLLSEFSPIGIFLSNVAGKIIYTNPLYQQIIGASAEEALGDGWKEFVHPDDRQWVFQYWSELIVTANQGVFNELRYQDRQGKVCYTQVRTAPIKSSDGTVILFVGTVEDITERRKIDQMKRDFISVVSHELRTPLTSIRGSLGLIAGGVYDKKPEKMKEMISIAARQSDRLMRLINDILDLRRLESGQTKFNFQMCAAAELIQQSVDLTRTQAEPNQITLSIIPSEVEVWADGDAIVQTITNLLSNAIKFSPPNSTITISAEVIPENLAIQEELPSVALFCVKDQGRGIPEDKLETIFGQFQQVDASDSREKGGTGLGLAICRNIIEQHSGKIWAESVLNKGSSFYFTLPLSSAALQ